MISEMDEVPLSRVLRAWKKVQTEAEALNAKSTDTRRNPAAAANGAGLEAADARGEPRTT